jgi:peptidoglycan/xylan/chitin deacetylase (PgdA/CDA1 family)
MRRLVQFVKVMLASALYYTGAFRVWQLIALRNRAVVLMYHRVLSDEQRSRTGSHPGIVVARGTFAQHMALVKRRFVVLTAEQLARHLSERIPLPHSSCVITFDDGWRDNLTEALPVLRQFGLPAIIFLPVNFIGQQRLFWRESLTHVLVDALHAAASDGSLRLRMGPVLESAGLTHLLDVPGADLRPAVIEAVAALPHLRVTSARRLIQAIETVVGRPVEVADTPDAFITWDQAREMAADGITFGGHGAEHVLLGEIPLDEARVDVHLSRDVLRAQIDAAVLAFSYPNGSFNADVADLVRAAGFTMAFTTREGPVRSTDNPMTLRRINIHEASTASPQLFLARVMGLF